VSGVIECGAAGAGVCGGHSDQRRATNQPKGKRQGLTAVCRDLQ